MPTPEGEGQEQGGQPQFDLDVLRAAVAHPPTSPSPLDPELVRFMNALCGDGSETERTDGISAVGIYLSGTKLGDVANLSGEVYTVRADAGDQSATPFDGEALE